MAKRMIYPKLSSAERDRLTQVLKILSGHGNTIADKLIAACESADPKELPAIVANHYSEAANFVAAIPRAMHSQKGLEEVILALSDMPKPKVKESVHG